MSENIIPLNSKNLPSFLKGRKPSLLSDLLAHASTGFPSISIKGKSFTIVREGERTVLMNPKDPDSKATYIEVVLLKVQPGVSKVFYAKAFKEGESDGVKPDCFSNDGIKPDAMVTNPVCSNCAQCPKNAWGSKISDDGRKGKACQDSVRVAVSTPDQVNEPYLLRFPPASIKELGNYGKQLEKRDIDYNMVVTRVGFTDDASPKLTLKAVGFLTDEAYVEATKMLDDDTVKAIIGQSQAPVAAVDDDPFETPEKEVAKEVIAKAAKAAVKTDTPEVTKDEVSALTAAVKQTKAKTPKAEAPKAEEPKVEAKSDDISIPGLDEFNFDD